MKRTLRLIAATLVLSLSMQITVSALQVQLNPAVNPSLASASNYLANGFTPLSPEHCVELAIGADRELRALRVTIKDLKSDVKALREEASKRKFLKKMKVTWDFVFKDVDGDISSFEKRVDKEYQLKELQLDEVDMRLNIRKDTLTAYYSVLESQMYYDFQKYNTSLVIENQVKLKQRQAAGELFAKEDITLLETAIKESQKQERNMKQNVEDSIIALGRLMKIDLTIPTAKYYFPMKFYSTEDKAKYIGTIVGNQVDTRKAILKLMDSRLSSTLTLKQLEKEYFFTVGNALEYSLNRNKSVVLPYFDYSGARSLATYIESQYKQKFGNWNCVSQIRPYFIEDPDMDFEEFKTKYDQFYKRIDDPWRWFMFIFFYPIHGMIFRTKGLSTRYLQDDKYAVYNLIKEETKTRNAYDKAVATQTQIIEKGFSALRNTSNTFQLKQSNTQRITLEYQNTLQLNTEKIKTMEQVEDKRMQLYESQKDQISALIEYNKELANFDKDTSGYVTKYLTGREFALAFNASGDAISLDLEEPMYVISLSVENNISELRVLMNKSPIEATHFEVWSGKGYQIGKKTPLSGYVRHLGFIFDEEDLAFVKLFNNEDHIYTAQIDATMPQGPLLFQKADTVVALDNTLGDYTLKNNGILSTLTLKPNALNENKMKFYTMHHSDTGAAMGSGERLEISKTFTYLQSLLQDISLVEVRFYDANGTQTFVAKLEKDLYENQKILLKPTS